MKIRIIVIISSLFLLLLLAFIWIHFSLGLNIALFQVRMGGTTYDVAVKIGSYPKNGTEDDMKKAILNVLRKRDSRIQFKDIQLDGPAFVDSTTNPPSPAKPFNITYTLLHQTGIVTKQTFRSSNVMSASVNVDFYNRSSTTVDSCDQWLSSSCIPFFYELVDGNIFMMLPQPG